MSKELIKPKTVKVAGRSKSEWAMLVFSVLIVISMVLSLFVGLF